MKLSIPGETSTKLFVAITNIKYIYGNNCSKQQEEITDIWMYNERRQAVAA